jgi:hypothetical protein
LAGQIPNVYLPIEVHSKLHFNHICLNHWQNGILNSQWFHGNTMGWIGFELASEDLKMIALKQVSSKWKSKKQNISLK